MAGRGGVGTGVGITIALLGVVALGSTVLAFVFWARMNTATKDAQAMKTQQAEFITDAERNNDHVRQLLQEAKKEGRGSLVAYLESQFRAVSEKVTGSPGETPKSLSSKIEAAVGAGNVMRTIDDLNAQKAQLETALKGAEAARAAAVANATDMQEKMKAAEAATKLALEAVGNDIKVYREGTETARTNLTTQQGETAAAIEKIRRDAADEAARLNDTISRQREELIVSQGKIKALQKERSNETLKPQDEATLVDGTVLAVVDADGTVYINRGRNDRVVLGMSFEVYGEPGQIKRSGEGDYSRGKASLEVIRVDETSSTCRVTRATRGNPVAKGDVIANALYDPMKKYAFLVFGNFDANRDGRSTPDEAGEIKAVISGWGGKLVDSLSGEVDFLVLGTRPVVPPQPDSTAPVPLVQEFIRLRNIAREYDRLFEQAAATSIPVLNENRLRTLIGR
ncbi:MAG TPA: hypothetical protein VFF65_13835 [Phycisphaerales bacterium]|nr:hypothetical protein [Phycisphaerales bacterium]